MFARIDNGRCAEFVHYDPVGKFHPDLLWLPVPDKYRFLVDINYIDVGGAIKPPSAEYLSSQIKSRIAEQRWRVQNAGIQVNNMAVRTADYDYAMLKGAIDALESSDIPDTDWKSTSGWVTVTSDDLPMLIAFRKGTAIHIRDCFRRERALDDALDAIVAASEPDVFDQLLAIDIKSGWPETLLDNKDA